MLTHLRGGHTTARTALAASCQLHVAPRGHRFVARHVSGYQNLSAIVYELDVYLTTSLDPQKVSLPPKFVFLTMQLLDRTLKAKVGSIVT